MKQNKINIFRWIAVLPGSLVAGFLATFPLHWILYYLAFAQGEPDMGSVRFFTDFFINKSNINSVEHFLSSIVTMMIFIMVGFEIAPNYKFKTSIILAILWVVLLLGTTIFMPDRFYLDMRALFTFISILIALYINWKKSKKAFSKGNGDGNPSKDR
jgi:hypothetical protein